MNGLVLTENEVPLADFGIPDFLLQSLRAYISLSEETCVPKFLGDFGGIVELEHISVMSLE